MSDSRSLADGGSTSITDSGSTSSRVVLSSLNDLEVTFDRQTITSGANLMR